MSDKEELYVIINGTQYTIKKSYLPDHNFLSIFDADFGGVVDLSIVENLENIPHLKTINITHSKLEDLKGLERLPYLKTLNLKNNNISLIISGLGALADLEYLYLNNNNITEINGLTELRNLKTLNLSNNKITEISGLENLENLRSLDLRDNQITEIKGLETLQNLTTLRLSNNPITKIEGLSNLESLEFIELENTKIPDKTLDLVRKVDGRISAKKIKNFSKIDTLTDILEESTEELQESRPKKVRKPREILKNLIQKYFSLMGFVIKENNKVLEIYDAKSSKPAFKYSFNRKVYLRHPDAELITFNSEELTKIIDKIVERGKIAKAFISFEFEPENSFNDALKKLVSHSNSVNESFLVEGDISFHDHYIGYIPFLIFIVKIELSSLEPFTIIEKPIIPLIDTEKKIQLDIEFYKQKLSKYFESVTLNLTDKMPVKGELLDLSDKKFMETLHPAIKEIENSIEEQRLKIEEKITGRLEKEVNILENYYSQRLKELESQIESARDRAKRELIRDLEKDENNIQKERDFKINEFKSIYKLDTKYELLGASLFYIPAIFYFNCKLNSPYGEIERKMDYDIFNNELVPLKCPSCGKELYHASICHNLHLSCPECSFLCKECEHPTCRSCDLQFCSECNAPLCQDHYYKCEKCHLKVCKEHFFQCEECGAHLCPKCSESCKICGKIVCKDNIQCSIHCWACKQYVCLDHAFSCSYDNVFYCNDEKYTCNSCHQDYCLYHIHKKRGPKCITCATASKLKFYKFLAFNKAQLTLPEEFRVRYTDYFEEIAIRTGTFKENYMIPRHQKDVKMEENQNFYIFILKNNTFLYYKDLQNRIIKLLKNELEGLTRKQIVDKIGIKGVDLAKDIKNLESTSKIRIKTAKTGKKIKPYIYVENYPDKLFKGERYYGMSLFFKNPSLIQKLFGNQSIKEELLIPLVDIEGQAPLKGLDNLPRCPDCNKTFSEDYKICPYCGTKLECGVEKNE